MGAQQSLPPYYAIETSFISLPPGIMPTQPAWSSLGDQILFNDYAHGEQYAVNATTHDLHCITCGTTDNPRLNDTFTYLFPDQKRLFIANEIGNDVYVLECPSGVLNCASDPNHKWKPVDLTGDFVPSQLSLGRRTFHLAPDGKHLAYTNTQLNGLLMLVCELEANATAYVAKNYRVVNPPGPTATDDPALQRWINGAGLTEFKSWADGGKSMVFVSQTAASNPDQFKMDLTTGNFTRLTYNADWDEDGAFSPDGSLLLTASWRTEHRIDAVGLFAPALPFPALPASAAGAIYYVSSRAGFLCNLQPWLLTATSDSIGQLGQPLAPYDPTSSTSYLNTTIPIYPSNNLAGHPIWHPNGNQLLIREVADYQPDSSSNPALLQDGPAPSRLRIATFKHKPPTAAIPIVETVIGSWAPTPQNYTANFNFPGTRIFAGAHAGSVTLSITGSLAGGNITAVYDGFSQDGSSFVSGTDSVTGSPVFTTVRKSNLTAVDDPSNVLGWQRGELTFAAIVPTPAVGEPSMTLTGDWSAKWDGEERDSLAGIGACPDTLPRMSNLSVTATEGWGGWGGWVNVVVTADVYGFVRPVFGAEVSLNGQTAITDISGKASLKGRANGKVIASAGSFNDASVEISTRGSSWTSRTS